MLHGINLEQLVQCYNIAPNVAHDAIMHLLDSGSTIFLTPASSHLTVQIRCDMAVNGIGKGKVNTMSPLIICVLDNVGHYHTMVSEATYHMPDLGFPIMPTGILELQGYQFYLAMQGSYMRTAQGRVIPLYRCALSGYHWVREEAHARPALEARQRVVAQFRSAPPADLKLHTPPQDIDMRLARDAPGTSQTQACTA